jgi:hypothetical protein
LVNLLGLGGSLSQSSSDKARDLGVRLVGNGSSDLGVDLLDVLEEDGRNSLLVVNLDGTLYQEIRYVVSSSEVCGVIKRNGLVLRPVGNKELTELKTYIRP